MRLDAPALQAWIGRSETLHDQIHPSPLLALAATLDHPSAPVAQRGGQRQQRAGVNLVVQGFAAAYPGLQGGGVEEIGRAHV